MRMENSNIFLVIKAGVAAALGAYGAAFGWLGWLVFAWIACMVLDWVSGSAAAAAQGEWSSAAARAGALHKSGMVFVVAVSGMADSVIQVVLSEIPALNVGFDTLVLPVVLVWYIFTELGSIAENAADMGAPLPPGLLRLLAVGKQTAEKHLDPDDGEEND